MEFNLSPINEELGFATNGGVWSNPSSAHCIDRKREKADIRTFLVDLETGLSSSLYLCPVIQFQHQFFTGFYNGNPTTDSSDTHPAL